MVRVWPLWSEVPYDCNCGGTPVPFLTTTVSGTTTSNCGYTIQPTTSNCPTPTTTLPPPTTAPPSVTVSCLTNSRSMLSSITPDLISHIMSAFCYLGTVSGPPNPLTIDAAHTFAQLYDGTTDRDGVYLYKPRDHLYVKMAADVPACQTKSLAIYRAGGEDCITSLGSVLAACPTYGGSLQSFDECFEWGVDSKTCLECQSSGLEME
ncbi:MAG: hypothetical protein LQ345_002417 [Seirophora villosa]|nr:MAG: hypothetical protein LQ345_002417 [Seirophora villosa]